jgi:acyl-coenzyme A thioesterase PaaI-like protein
MDKMRITGILTLILGLLLLKVTATYAAPCTSAVAEIDPTSVNVNTDNQAFSYYIEPRISEYESGIRRIEIRVPDTYSNIHVTGVWIGGQSLSLYTDSTSGNTISVAFGLVNIDGTDLRVDFTADTPGAPDSGVPFTSLVYDDLPYVPPVSCTSGDGDGGGSIATNTWTVTAGYAGPCTSAVAEIDPTSVNVNTDNQAFSYYIEPRISEYESGINSIEIRAPDTYSDIHVTGVWIGGQSLSLYTDNTSGNTISVAFATVNIDGTDLQVDFTAGTPGVPDSGVAFTSTVDHTGYPDAVSCTSGDGDDGGSITANIWTVTAGYAGSCTSAVAEIDPTSVNVNTDNQAFSYYIEPRISEYESGIDRIDIVAPNTYFDIIVTDVLVGGVSVSYVDNTSGNTISVVTSATVTTDGANLRVNFTADTPGVPDSGVAFTSTVDHTGYPDPVSCASGDGDGGIATNTWTVTAGYAGSCTSAVAEIDPTSVNINTEDQAFSYFILPTINADDSGVDKIEIRVPDSYSGLSVTGVSVGGDTSSQYDNNTSGNTISVTLPAKVTTNGTQLRVNFTADTPGAVDSGVAFTSTVDDTEYPDSVSCTSGDGDGGGSIATNTWTVTAGHACTSAVAEIDPTSVNQNTDDQAFSYYIEPTISEYESGINRIEIRAPDTYSDIIVTDVLVGGVPVSYVDNSTGNTISVVTSAEVTTDGANLRVNFTADTPGAPDSGVAFTSTVDHTGYPDPVSCASGDGDGGGSIATNTWTVTAGYPGPCTSAVAEIDPIYVNINTEDQAFSYFILPTINADDSGVDKIEIKVPDTYFDLSVTGVSVGGDTSSEYDSNTADNTILVTLPAKVTTNGTQLRVNFTADTPGAVDSGGAFTSTVDDTEYPASVSCTSGDGDGGGSVSTNTWVVTSPVSDGGNGCFIGTAACGFTMEPYRPSHK